MPDLITPAPVIAPDPRDRATTFTWLWLAWIAAFGVLEYRALRDDARSPDRAKRSLSSNLRWWAATDSITGIPTNAKLGKLRRLALICAEAWLAKHLERNGVV